MFHLQTLGRLGLKAATGAAVQGIQTRPKDLILLTYLAVARPYGFQRRDTLLALLWPELDAAHGRNALSQALHRLRASLTPDVVVIQGRDDVGLSPRLMSCDAVVFEQQLQDGDLAPALRSYVGDFLAGVHVAGVAAEFDDWLIMERERLQRRAFNALLVLIDVEEKSGSDRAVVEWLRRARELRPSDETVCRRLLEALAATGDRAGAIAEYEGFARQLSEQYGLAPSPRTRAIPDALRNQALRFSERPQRHRPDPTVLEYFLKGRYFTSTVLDTARGLEYLQRALVLDPAYAPAHAATALSIVNLAVLGHLAPADGRARAGRAAARAIDLDPAVAEAHTALATVAMMFDWDWRRAEREFRIGISCNPNSSDAHTYFAQFLCAVGRPDEGVAEAEIAQQLDPLGLWANFVLGWALFRARRHEASLRRLRDVMELYPQFAFAHLFVAENHLQKEAYADAIDACRSALRILPEDQLLLGLTACVAGLSGDRELAHDLQRRLDSLGASRYVCPGHRAAAHLGVADPDRAFEKWEAMCRDRSALAPLVATDPLYDTVRGDPRFGRLLQQLGLQGVVSEVRDRRRSAS